MIHGPCGYLAPKAPCCAGGTCDKKYPREFQPVTEMQDNGYPLYRRRDTALRNVGNKGHSLVDDRWVVPYNPYLLLRHDAHINVEITAGVRFVKYMYKYTYKGHDRARLEVGGQGTSHTAVDEIRAFVDARYVGPCEAAWRLLQFPLSGMSHSVVRLDVHLPDEHRMLFRAGEEAAAMEKPAARRSMLTAWFTYNAAWTQHRDLLYSDFPSVCRYDRPTGTWVARSPWHLSASGERVLTRLQTATPVENERFYLYLLLLNVRGAASYEDLRTDDEGIVHPTFRACCLARQLVDGDAEHQLALEDAASLQSAAALRLLFAVMLLYCEVADPPHLWERFKVPFTEDFRRESKSDTLAEELALEHLETILAGEGKRNADFNLPSSGLASETDWARRALMEARCFDPDKERAASTTAYDRMNPEQAPALVDGHSDTRSTPSMPLSSASFFPLLSARCAVPLPSLFASCYAFFPSPFQPLRYIAVSPFCYQYCCSFFKSHAERRINLISHCPLRLAPECGLTPIHLCTGSARQSRCSFTMVLPCLFALGCGLRRGRCRCSTSAAWSRGRLCAPPGRI